ncbi:MAG TPA: enoyl-CoA hydratase-related protein [Acidimicrobiales bacterium]|nr:enoyl-CoA hydratase-related protein [Acidimicrobiales bacterium]
MSETGDAPLVRLVVDDRIATITLDSPANRNALSRRLLVELAGHLAAARDDPGVRAVVLTATGTTFCSGADLADPPGAGAAGSVSLPEILTDMWRYPKAIVVRLNGHVRAGGTGLVAAADIVVAPSSATFAFTEVRIGVAPAVIAVVCGRRMSARALARYTLTGERFDAAAAADAGLVTIVVEPDALDAAVAEVADAVRLTEPNAVRATKDLLTRLPAMGLDEGFSWAEELSQRLFRSPEAAEGIQAFREKRPPVWASGQG